MRNCTYNEFLVQEDLQWAKYFNMDKITNIATKAKNKRKFSVQIQSDGVSVSVLYTTTMKRDVNVQQKIQRIRRNYNNYEKRTAIDVGFNTYMAATITTIKSGKEINVKLKAKQYHRRTKLNKRKKKFERLAGDYERLAANDRNNSNVLITPTGPNFWQYVRHTLQFWARGIAVYTTVPYANMAFNKYRNCQRVMDELVSKLTNKRPTLFLIGGADFSPNSPIKGHLRCPGIRKLIKILSKYPECDYLFVDEFNTSQHCGLCIKKFDPATRNHRQEQVLPYQRSW